MTAVKITVLKRALHTDLVKVHSNLDVKKCEVFTEGQEFITGLNMPEGFCQWAWDDISKVVLSIYTGGGFDKGIFKNWMKHDNTMIACCTDGLRPVTFKFERIDTKSLIDVSGIERPAPLEAYDSERWGEFFYSFTGLKPEKKYKVRLHFCEVYHSKPRRRDFSVKLGDKLILENYDILADTGGKYKAVVKEFEVSADKSGSLVINFIKGTEDYPKVSAIEIMKSAADTAAEAVYAVNAGGHACGSFSADKYFTGGNAVTE
jgi:uncharacterized repeat protein (TIGR04076 family)